MNRGFEGLVADGEADFRDLSCPLVLSLTACLQELCGTSDAVPHLERALADLGSPFPARMVAVVGRRSSPDALAAYLDFLIPELRMRSPKAAISVRWAAEALRGSQPVQASVRAH